MGHHQLFYSMFGVQKVYHVKFISTNMITRCYAHARTHTHTPVVYTAVRRNWVTLQSVAAAVGWLRESTGERAPS